jgi:hypothetical protein
MLHVQCGNCGAWGVTEDGSLPDAAARCTSAADDPPGSPAALCCTDHEDHEAHVAHVRATGDASCRPVTITLLPGTAVVN